MGFYSDKITTYSRMKDTLSFESKMQLVKERKEEELFNEYACLNEQYKNTLATQVPVHGVQVFSVIDGFYKSLAGEKRQELKTISSLTPQAYFAKLAMQEHINLSTYSKAKVDEYQKIANQISRATGVMSGVKGFFGFKTDVALLNEKQELVTSEYCAGDKALDEWRKLSSEEQISYLVNRAYYEQQYSFNPEALDNYAHQQLAVEAQEDDEVEVEVIDLDALKLKDTEAIVARGDSLTVEDIAVK